MGGVGGAAAGGRRMEGRVAVVTASTAGIGLAISRRLGQEGAKVVVSSRKQAAVDETVTLLRKEGIEVTGEVCHVASADQRKQLIATAVETYGKIDILVSNAAVNPASGPILQMSENAIDKILEVNIKAAVLLIRDAANHLSERASILLVSSVTGYSPSAPLGMYAVSKTALLGLTKALAEELAPNTRVNCLAPGIVKTKFAAALVSDEKQRVEREASTLLGRLGLAEEMAGAAAFLCSDDASYITGETLVVSGGMQSRL
eukprot:jgi/Chlat1/126/Chrsp1S03225